ncbi:MAG: dihydrolipoyl dehydrogenase [Candidatus Aenigmarchaeota archaeon]|nr:dihydrolipoyl dehydrogenase [Candidatus Aenigmarchaeota archaeon]
MQRFDAVVVGAGSGLNIADALAGRGQSVAIVEEGPMGGTCLNRGCIPSKIEIHSADVMELLRRSAAFGIKTSPLRVDFAAITRRASQLVDRDAREIEAAIRANKRLTLFKARAAFVGDRTLRIGTKTIRGEKIFILAGTRPVVPPIPGLGGAMTSDQALRLTKQPRSLIVLGGGYIAAELAHFFGALGTQVTVVQRSGLLNREDQEIAAAFTQAFQSRHRLLLGYEVTRVERKAAKVVVHVAGKEGEKTLEADQLLVATGRVPNSDLLDVGKAGIRTDKAGYIVTNEFLETSAPGVWAAGDIAGKFLFKHSANLEATVAAHNALFPGRKYPADYTAMPHAIFTAPQIAAVGETEQQLQERRARYVVGRYWYKDTGMGAALQDEEGFVKLLAEKGTRKILGCHIIGPEAATLIHEVLVAMKHANAVDSLVSTIHIHPALSEVVQRAARAAAEELSSSR